MTSVMREYDQVPSQSSFLLVVSAATSAATTGTSAPSASVATVAGQAVQGLMTVAQFNTATIGSAAANLVVGQLYRSLGERVTVYDPTTNLAVQKFVKAQLVSGAAGEGVGTGSFIRYIRVWAADATLAVPVARTG